MIEDKRPRVDYCLLTHQGIAAEAPHSSRNGATLSFLVAVMRPAQNATINVLPLQKAHGRLFVGPGMLLWGVFVDRRQHSVFSKASIKRQ